MKALDIINAKTDIKKKIQLLTGTKDKNIEKYIEYYGGVQDIKDKRHPTNDNKTDQLNKLVFNLYKKITNVATWFLFGEEPELILNNKTDKNEKLFEEFKKSYNEAKTDIINQKIGIETLGFSESAELLYTDEAVKYQFLSTKSESFFPFWDERGNMDAFTRIYKLNEFDEQAAKIIEVEYTEIYTQTEMYKYRKYKNEYSQITVKNEDGKEKNVLTYDKIPIVYYKTEPLAWDVKSLLDRYNDGTSTLSDINDAFAYPILKLIGELVKNAKGEVGLEKKTASVIHLQSLSEDGEKQVADAQYLVWATKPESAIYEIENLKNNIEYLTSTPNISLENLKNLTNITGIALLLMFTDAEAQSKFLQNIFFKLKRRINVHKSLLEFLHPTQKFTELDISMKFKSPIPENRKELIENISMAKMNEFLSTDTAVDRNFLVTAKEEEKKLLKEESQIEAGSFNIE